MSIPPHPVTIVTNLEIGSNVIFMDSNGQDVAAKVLYLWPGMGEVPGVNLEECSAGTVHTSVPHYSSVRGATGFYWTLGYDGAKWDERGLSA